MGSGLGDTIISFNIRRCSTLAMNLLGLLSACENLIFGKDLWELEVTINERIKVANINGGEKAIIIWFFIFKLNFHFNYYYFFNGASSMVLKPIFWIDKAFDFSHFQKEFKAYPIFKRFNYIFIAHN